MKRLLPIIILAVVAVAFLMGLFELFRLRFEAGDVYPAYSSLRSDPLGTMGFYESLGRIGLEARRDFSSENRLPAGRGSTYLHLGAEPEEWGAMPEEVVQEIERFVIAGGRLVVAFFPESDFPAGMVMRGGVPPPPSTKPKSKKAQAEELRRLRRTSLKERWGFGFRTAPLEREDEGYRPAQASRQGDRPLPPELDWHSGLVFTNLEPAWETVYARGTNPVVVERKLGAGSVVMTTDGYFLSNQALVKDRHPDLLEWVVGSSAREVLFDEAHLGLVDTPGVATLMRKYRLHWLGAGLLLLAALFIWKNSTSFLPAEAAEQGRDDITGKEASAGFVNLLRRNIPPRDLLRVCFDEWTRTLTQGGSHSIARIDQAQAVLEAENSRAAVDRNAVRAYGEICRVLKAKG